MTAQAAEREPLCALAAIAAAAAVGLGAYGAHGLAVDDFLLDVWRTAVAFQMWHALGVFACVWLASRKSGRAASLARISGWLHDRFCPLPKVGIQKQAWGWRYREVKEIESFLDIWLQSTKR